MENSEKPNLVTHLLYMLIPTLILGYWEGFLLTSVLLKNSVNGYEVINVVS